MKPCSTCKVAKPPSDFYGDRRRPDGLKSQCKKCHSISTMAARNPDAHRVANREWMRRSKYATRSEVRERQMMRSRARGKTIEVRARALANRAVDLGFLERPVACPRCGLSGMVHAHHHDYSKPLEVQWLCVQCHADIHRLAHAAPDGGP